MAKLNQIIAAEKGVKGRVESALTEAYKTIQKPDLFSGLSRTYTPLDENGEKRPGEHKKVQQRTEGIIKDVAKQLVELFDTVATKELTNTEARGSIVVDGKTLIADAPVATLLFLEKKLVDIRTFVSKMPELDPTETWEFDPKLGCYVTHPVEQLSARKVEDYVVVVPATKEHPAQIAKTTKDMTAGTWATVKQSGAMAPLRVRTLLGRVEALQTAVKFAREEANSIAVKPSKIGETILNHIFAE